MSIWMEAVTGCWRAADNHLLIHQQHSDWKNNNSALQLINSYDQLSGVGKWINYDTYLSAFFVVCVIVYERKCPDEPSGADQSPLYCLSPLISVNRFINTNRLINKLINTHSLLSFTQLFNERFSSCFHNFCWMKWNLSHYLVSVVSVLTL